MYCPKGYKVQENKGLQAIYDGEKLLQIFKVCESATLRAQTCTANKTCKEFEYKLQECALGEYHVANNFSSPIICKKNKTGNMPFLLCMVGNTKNFKEI